MTRDGRDGQLAALEAALRAADADAAAALVRRLLEDAPDVALTARLARALRRDGRRAFEPAVLSVATSLRVELLADALVGRAAADGLALEVRTTAGPAADDPAAADPAPAGAARFHLVLLAGEDLVPSLYDGSAGPDELPALEARALAAVVGTVARRRAAVDDPILVAGFAPPRDAPADLDRAAGGLDPDRAVRALNDRLADELAAFRNVRVLDYARLVARTGAAGWYDARLSLLGGGRAPSPAAAAALAREVTRHLRALTGRSRKLLVTDLDGVLWGGVLGEDGPDGIRLGPDGPGAAYRAVQRALLGLRRRGVLLAALSKNDPADVAAVLAGHPFMVLRPDDFSALEVGWGDKPDALSRILARLGLAPGHAVFLDDSPVERAAVRARLPGVVVPEAARRPDLLLDHLLVEGWFDGLARTAEDVGRAAAYAAAAAARRRAAAPDGAGLAELATEVRLLPAGGANAARAAQLTQRVNQLNTTGRRCSPDDIAAWAAAPGRRALVAALRDRFGDHGRVGLLLLALDGEAARIEGLYVSCRALGRGLDTVLLAAAARLAAAAGARRLLGRVVTLPRNEPARAVYARHGFAPAGGGAGETVWRRELAAGPIALPDHVRLVDETVPPAEGDAA